MSVLNFSDLYITECERCGAELEWDWLEDNLLFEAACICGCEYTLTPVNGTLTTVSEELEDDDDYSDE